MKPMIDMILLAKNTYSLQYTYVNIYIYVYINK